MLTNLVFGIQMHILQIKPCKEETPWNRIMKALKSVNEIYQRIEIKK